MSVLERDVILQRGGALDQAEASADPHDQEQARRKDFAPLIKEVKTQIAEHGKRWAWSNIPTKSRKMSEKSYTVTQVPEDLVPQDAMASFEPGEEIHLTVSLGSNAEPTITFKQGYVTADVPKRHNTTVTYNLSGTGSKVIERRATSLNKKDPPLARRTQPDQHSFISKGAVTQLLSAIANPYMQPNNLYLTQPLRVLPH